MKALFWTAVFFLGVWDLYSVLPPRPPFPDPGRPPAPYKEGIIHVHSLFSDGGGTVAEIAQAAKKAGLDFVVLTDHNTSTARRDNQEKNYNGVDVFVEMEASTPAGHALTFFSHTEARNLTDAQVNQLAWNHFLGHDTRPGMFVVSAHPSNLKIPWTALDRQPDGTEVINLDSIWRELADHEKIEFGFTLLVYPLNGFLSALRFLEVNPKDFLAWDTMNAVSKGHFGILGHDTHAMLKLNREIAWRWPGYLQTFKLASNIIYYKDPLPADFEERKKALYRSLREGRNAIVLKLLYPFQGNDWRLECGDSVYRSGDDVSAGRGNCQFVAEVPRGFPYKATVRLIRNGELARELPLTQGSVHIPLETVGVYRLEVWVHLHTSLHLLLERNVPYVFYNPIYVR